MPELTRFFAIAEETPPALETDEEELAWYSEEERTPVEEHEYDALSETEVLVKFDPATWKKLEFSSSPDSET